MLWKIQQKFQPNWSLECPESILVEIPQWLWKMQEKKNHQSYYKSFVIVIWNEPCQASTSLSYVSASLFQTNGTRLKQLKAVFI